MSALERGDRQVLTSLLAEVCPVGDESQTDVEEAQNRNKKDKKVPFPLPLDHWINSPLDGARQHKTLLQLAVEHRGPERLDMVRSVLSAGARADAYNERTGGAAVHAAADNGDLEALKVLLDFMVEKPKINRYFTIAYEYMFISSLCHMVHAVAVDADVVAAETDSVVVVAAANNNNLAVLVLFAVAPGSGYFFLGL